MKIRNTVIILKYYNLLHQLNELVTVQSYNKRNLFFSLNSFFLYLFDIFLKLCFSCVWNHQRNLKLKCMLKLHVHTQTIKYLHRAQHNAAERRVLIIIIIIITIKITNRTFSQLFFQIWMLLNVSYSILYFIGIFLQRTTVIT